MTATCFFAQFSKKPCKGIIQACHLIAKDKLKHVKAGLVFEDNVEPIMWDLRNIVPGCQTHHADFDKYNLEVPREALPEVAEEFAKELGLEWVLDRRFGTLEQ